MPLAPEHVGGVQVLMEAQHLLQLKVSTNAKDSG